MQVISTKRIDKEEEETNEKYLGTEETEFFEKNTNTRRCGCQRLNSEILL
jgi:hypothetical protein